MIKKHNDYITLTIVIPTYNEEGYIQNCLESILNNEVSFNYEIVLVDGGSTDKTCIIAEQIAKSTDRLSIIFNKERYTSQALNKGIKKAEGKYILLLGAHSRLPGDHLQKAVDNIIRHKVACVGGRVHVIGNLPISKDIAYVLQSPFGIGNAKFRYSNKEQFVDTVAFGCYQREVFTEVGYFDEELIRGQDYELNHRIIQSGKRILFIPDYHSFWYARTSLKKMASQQFNNGYWKVLAQIKRKGVSSYRHMVPFLFVSAIVVLLVLSLFDIVYIIVLLSFLSFYLIISFCYSIKAIRNNVRYWLLPVIYLVLHFSYGLGYMLGIIYFPFYIFVKFICKEKAIN